MRLLAKLESRLKLQSIIGTVKRIARISAEPNDWFQNARVAYNQKRYDDALLALDSLLSIDPEHPKGLQLKIRALINSGNHAIALDELNRLDAMGTLDDNLGLRRAELNYTYGNIKVAQQAYESLWSKTGSIESAKGLIRSLMAEANYISALDIIDSVDTHVDANILFLRLRCLHKLARFNEIVESFEAGRALVEREPRILHFVALAEKDRGFNDRAIHLWQELSLFQPENLDIEISIAGVLYDSHDNYRAKVHLDKVLSKEPNHEKALWLNSQIHVREEAWVSVFGLFERLHKIDPSSVKYWRSHIEILYRLNRQEEAEYIFFRAENLIEIVSESRFDLIFLAEEFLWTAKAKKMCREIIEEREDITDTLIRLIHGYYSMGKSGSAARFALCLRQRDEVAFENSKAISRLLNLLEWANISLNDCAGAPFGGQLNNEIYNTELVAKAIVDRTKHRSNTPPPLRTIGMLSSTFGRGGAERQMLFCLNSIQDDKTLNCRIDLFLNRNASRDPEDTYFGDLKTNSLVVHDYGFPVNMDLLDHPLSKYLEPWLGLVSHIPDSSQNRRNLVGMFYAFISRGYDIIHAWQDLTNVFGAMAALMAGVPRILLSARSLSPDTKTMLHMRKAGFLRGAYLQLLKAERVVLCHNSDAGAQSYRDWLGTDIHRFPVLHNGTAFDQLEMPFDQKEAMRMSDFIHWSNQRRVIGAVFRFVPEKRPLMWLEVAAEVLQQRRDVCFLMVGDGPLFNEVCEKVQQKGISDSFFFPGVSNSVGSWLKKMDVFLLTSKIEGLPNVVIEAQGFGVPVVTTDAGGVEEVMISGGTGFIVKNDNVRRLSEQLLWCLGHDEWRKNASVTAIKNSRTKFSVEGMYERLLKLYHII